MKTSLVSKKLHPVGLLFVGKKVLAVKSFRDRTDASLKEAKVVMDYYQERYRLVGYKKIIHWTSKTESDEILRKFKVIK